MWNEEKQLFFQKHFSFPLARTRQRFEMKAEQERSYRGSVFI